MNKSVLVLLVITVWWSFQIVPSSAEGFGLDFKVPIKNNLVMIGNKVYRIETNKGNWFQAVRKCHTLGGELAAVKNEEQKNTLTAYLQKHFSKVDNLWLGVNDLAEDGNFVSMVTNQPITYSFWQSGRPIAGDNTEDCVVIRNNAGKYYMYDVDCYQSYGYICEMNDRLGSYDTSVTLVPSNLVPTNNFDKFLKIGTAYYFFDTERVTWHEALRRCRAMNADLATIETSIERSYLINFYCNKYGKDEFWIGCNDIGNEGTFRWEKTGKAITQSFWASGRPVTDDSQNCVKIEKNNNRYVMYDRSCTARSGYICQAKLPPQQNPLTHSLITVSNNFVQLNSKKNHFKKSGDKYYYLYDVQTN